MDKAERIAAIAAITQIFKYYGAPSKWCPMIAIALGALMEYADNPTPKGILDGVVVGAMVTGSYGMLKGAAQATITKSASPNFSLMEAEDDRGL
ncbi:hypothetical protein HZA44_02895 [Candidatus Peregrinibacteria bacterium]|nr:hypothetical protein [Candidatus Peregrinibacteria bacterium]